MEGLKINFLPGVAGIDTQQRVSGFDTTIQNALVNIGTRTGTDSIYPTKGTTLLKRALEGKIVGLNSANHESQLAGLNTLYFSREYETSTDGVIRLGRVDMTPLIYENGSLRINVTFTNQAQTLTVGTTTIL
jgi:hypothetical protein